MKKEDFCDGCCYRHTCDGNLEVCCYLVKAKCIVENPNEEEFL